MRGALRLHCAEWGRPASRRGVQRVAMGIEGLYDVLRGPGVGADGGAGSGGSSGFRGRPCAVGSLRGCGKTARDVLCAPRTATGGTARRRQASVPGPALGPGSEELSLGVALIIPPIWEPPTASDPKARRSGGSAGGTNSAHRPWVVLREQRCLEGASGRWGQPVGNLEGCPCSARGQEALGTPRGSCPEAGTMGTGRWVAHDAPVNGPQAFSPTRVPFQRGWSKPQAAPWRCARQPGAPPVVVSLMPRGAPCPP